MRCWVRSFTTCGSITCCAAESARYSSTMSWTPLRITCSDTSCEGQGMSSSDLRSLSSSDKLLAGHARRSWHRLLKPSMAMQKFRFSALNCCRQYSKRYPQVYAFLTIPAVSGGCSAGETQVSLLDVTEPLPPRPGVCGIPSLTTSSMGSLWTSSMMLSGLQPHGRAPVAEASLEVERLPTRAFVRNQKRKKNAEHRPLARAAVGAWRKAKGTLIQLTDADGRCSRCRRAGVLQGRQFPRQR
mmetsp:Transcript_34450/g.108511  ORF Transcript_34450/g.108511 Transcript_34450/m.108511 type:complete len:242 (-) Transcript_34450:198-923(-)